MPDVALANECHNIIDVILLVRLSDMRLGTVLKANLL